MSGELLGLFADFTWKGRLYKIAPRDIATESMFGDWCAAEAALKLARIKANVPADIYLVQMREYAELIAGHGFDWGSAAVHNSFWTEPGRRHMLWLKIQRGASKGGGSGIERPEIDQLAEDRSPEGKAKWEELLGIMYRQDEPDFFAALEKERQERAPPPASPDGTSPTPPLPDSTPPATA